MFESTPVSPPDAVFGLNEDFNRDPNPDKINLTVGMYQDESGKTPIMRCVRQAEQQMMDEAASHIYLPIDGMRAYNQRIAELILGPDHAAISEKRTQSAQTPGGTAALRVAGDLLQRVYNVKRIWISDPTWANHPKIFRSADLEICQYPYLDENGTALNFDQMSAAIAEIYPGDAILLHTVCHNPTGVDLNQDQWQRLLQIVKQRNLIPIFDFAYQGFGQGVDNDAQPIREFCDSQAEALICNSFSKNFNLYGERVGGITAVARTPETTSAIMSQIKAIIRTMYSNPPTHGAAIVAKVLSDDVLRADWIAELDGIRIRIGQLREQFVNAIGEKLPGVEFGHIRQQRGMFSYSGINADAVQRLKTEYSVYLLNSGRINVAGINASNLNRLCDAIAAVLQQPVDSQ